MKRQLRRMSGHRRFQKPANPPIWFSTARIGNCPPRRFWSSCAHSCPDNTNWPKSSANGSGWMSHRLASRFWPKCFGRWAFTGTVGAVFGSIPAAHSTRSPAIPPTRAPSIAPTLPPTCCPPEMTPAMNHTITNHAGTVSETVSESTESTVENSGGLNPIPFEFPSILAIFPILNRTFHVAARPCPPSPCG